MRDVCHDVRERARAAGENGTHELILCDVRGFAVFAFVDVFHETEQGHAAELVGTVRRFFDGNTGTQRDAVDRRRTEFVAFVRCHGHRLRRTFLGQLGQDGGTGFFDAVSCRNISVRRKVKITAKSGDFGGALSLRVNGFGADLFFVEILFFHLFFFLLRLNIGNFFRFYRPPHADTRIGRHGHDTDFQRLPLRRNEGGTHKAAILTDFVFFELFPFVNAIADGDAFQGAAQHLLINLFGLFVCIEFDERMPAMVFSDPHFYNAAYRMIGVVVEKHGPDFLEPRQVASAVGMI